ncbi:hypothetical protein HK101_009359 [Irineochytrium annulatum]|nr:hypothetical protein HK101_009359 [Irineochytrium annulatum]
MCGTVEVVGSIQGLVSNFDIDFGWGRITERSLAAHLALSSVFMVGILIMSLMGRTMVHGLSVFFLGILILSFASWIIGVFTTSGDGDGITGFSWVTLQENLYPSKDFNLRMDLTLMMTLSWSVTVLALTLVSLLALTLQARSRSSAWGTGIEALSYQICLNYLANREREEHIERLCIHYSHLEPSLHMDYAPSHHSTSRAGGGNMHSETTSITRRAGSVLTTHHQHPWRPQLLAFVPVDDDRGCVSQPRLVDFIGQLRGGGEHLGELCILASVITREDEERHLARSAALDSSCPFAHELARAHQQPGEDANKAAVDRARAGLVLRRRLALISALRDSGVQGFVKVFRSPTARMGRAVLIQTAGLGDLTPNTVVAVWPPCAESYEENLSTVGEVSELWSLSRNAGMTVLIIKGLEAFPARDERLNGTIDVWWIVHDGQLLLLLAYLLKKSPEWHGATLRLYVISQGADSTAAVERGLHTYLEIMRISLGLMIIKVAEINVVPVNLYDDVREGGSVASNDTEHEVFEHRMEDCLRREMDVADGDLLRMIREQGPAIDRLREQHRDRVDREDNAQPTTVGHERGRFIRAWVQGPGDIPHFQRRDLFLKARMAARLRQEISARSMDADLVLLNLPSPDVHSLFNHQDLTSTEKAGLYMELIEFLTADLKRVLLLHPGK